METREFLPEISKLRRARAERGAAVGEIEVLDFQSCWSIFQASSSGWQPSQNTNRVIDFGLHGTFEVRDFLSEYQSKGAARVFVYLDPVPELSTARDELRKNGLKKGVEIQVLVRSLANINMVDFGSFDISVATESNWDDITQVLSFGGSQPPQWNEITWSSLQSDFATVLIARKSGVPAALGVLNCLGNFAYLSNGLTRPEYRNLGAQKSLIQARLELAREKGCEVAYSETYSFFAPSYDNLLKCGFQDAFGREIFRFEFEPKLQEQLEDTEYGHPEPSP